MNILPIRAHHLLCCVLYIGKGYSENFTNNMDGVVSALKSDDAIISLQGRPDVICSSCPNLNANGDCNLSDASEHDLGSLDQALLDFFGFEENKPLSRKEVYETVMQKITPEFFGKCCKNCRWYKEGLCHYDDYITRLNSFIN